MDHRNSDRTARPQIPQRPAVGQPVAEEYVSPRPQSGWAPQSQGDRRKRWPIHVAITAVVLLLAVLGWWLMSPKGTTLAPATDRYQAIFLNNGQVFFGKLKNTSGEYLVLEKAYYTKKAEVPADATEEQKAAIEANVSLAKVGNEVYGPESTMSIRAEQVLFWQNLKSDSKVSKAIESAN